MATTPQAMVDRLVADLDRSLGGSYAAVLYGSLARGDWVEGVSDINLLIVLDDAPRRRWRAPSAAARLVRRAARWRRCS